MNGWIGVDLDGTLVEYDSWVSPGHLGAPVPRMVARVRAWLAEGYEVRIFTARVSHDGSAKQRQDVADAMAVIDAFTEEQFGVVLPVTNVKDYGMIELWDDRCVQVEPNTGRPMGQSVSRLV